MTDLKIKNHWTRLARRFGCLVYPAGFVVVALIAWGVRTLV